MLISQSDHHVIAVAVHLCAIRSHSLKLSYTVYARFGWIKNTVNLALNLPDSRGFLTSVSLIGGVGLIGCRSCGVM